MFPLKSEDNYILLPEVKCWTCTLKLELELEHMPVIIKILPKMQALAYLSISWVECQFTSRDPYLNGLTDATTTPQNTSFPLGKAQIQFTSRALECNFKRLKLETWCSSVGSPFPSYCSSPHSKLAICCGQRKTFWLHLRATANAFGKDISSFASIKFRPSETIETLE